MDRPIGPPISYIGTMFYNAFADTVIVTVVMCINLQYVFVNLDLLAVLDVGEVNSWSGTL